MRACRGLPLCLVFITASHEVNEVIFYQLSPLTLQVKSIPVIGLSHRPFKFLRAVDYRFEK